MAINEVFHALGDPTRREILRLLRRRDMSAGELAEKFPLAKSTLSGHFNVLRQAGLIVSEKHGTVIRYSLNVSAVEEAVEMVMSALHVGARKKDTKERSS
jgi:DNA-binding transcriptional ArsR family regulator